LHQFCRAETRAHALRDPVCSASALRVRAKKVNRSIPPLRSTHDELIVSGSVRWILQWPDPGGALCRSVKDERRRPGRPQGNSITRGSQPQCPRPEARDSNQVISSGRTRPGSWPMITSPSGPSRCSICRRPVGNCENQVSRLANAASRSSTKTHAAATVAASSSLAASTHDATALMCTPRYSQIESRIGAVAVAFCEGV